ncbi:MAG TPA: M42 family peptidase, partial [Solirubrobacteraceae bacterium]|nr:M42 family peptidase [Solirubrobacteraceae bacterium]
MPTPELLQRLLSSPGPSGHETEPARVWREFCGRFAEEVGSDGMGSSFARVPGQAGGPKLAVVGHIDEIGLHISHIDKEGYLRFGAVGGWDPLVLIAQRVRIRTREGSVMGVIGRKPIHLLKEEERKKVPELKELHIDIGAADADEARRLVRIGDVAVIEGEPLEFPNERVVSRSVDNRIGCYVAAEAARLVAEAGGAPGEVLALAVAQEETGL